MCKNVEEDRTSPITMETELITMETGETGLYDQLFVTLFAKTNSSQLKQQTSTHVAITHLLHVRSDHLQIM